MNVVSSQHPQFLSRSNDFMMAGTLEQQDTYEFFLALMDILSNEEDEENKDLGGGLARSSEDKALVVLYGVDGTRRDDGFGSLNVAMQKLFEFLFPSYYGCIRGGEEVCDHHVVESKDWSNVDQCTHPPDIIGKTTTYASTKHEAMYQPV